MTTNIDIGSDLTVGGNVTVNGQLNCDGAATFNDAITANTIQPNATNTGSVGSSSLYYDTAYINKAYLGYIETLVYMQNGASFYGPLNILNSNGDDIFSITVNSSNQLQIASSGETNPILVSDTSNNVNFPGNLSVGGTSTLTGAVTASEIQVNPTGGNPQGITINGSSTSGSGTQIFFQESGTTYWQMGPNYGSTGGGGGPHDFWLMNNATATNVLQIQSASNAIIFNAPINFNTSTEVAGTTAGSYYYLMPFQGASYKKVIVYFVGYENDTITGQTVPFPTAFTTLGSITSNSTNGLSTSNSTLTLSNTELVINGKDGTIYNGVIIIEGF